MNKRWVWDGKPWQAFKTFATIFSFIVNLVLVIVLLLIAPQIIPTVDNVAEPLVGGLNQSFVDMGEASIIQAIEVDDTLPISFTLPLSQATVVVLREPVPLGVNATFNLPGGGGSINGFVTLELPAGLPLPVDLNMSIPVEQVIPVQLNVPVDIELSQTELGSPFNTLEALFAPLDGFVTGLPSSNSELFDRLQGSALGGETGPALSEDAAAP